MWNETIKLIAVSVTVNSLGNSIETETKKEVFANKKSIRQSEFYQAQSTGLKPELMFVIREADYNNEQYIEYNLKRYNVIRTYSTKNEGLEIVCNRITGGEVRS